MRRYCSRVEYYRGAEVASAISNKVRPVDGQGQNLWDRAADKVANLDLDVDDYLDWCFKEAIPGLPFPNTLATGVDKFLGLGSPVTSRKEVALHTKLLLDRFKRLLDPQDGLPTVFPEDILFDPRHEFHPVFATEMASSLKIEAPEHVKDIAQKINKCMPYYLNEMQNLLKDWTAV